MVTVRKMLFVHDNFIGLFRRLPVCLQNRKKKYYENGFINTMKNFIGFIKNM